MPSYDPELTSGDPYYDDYDADKKFLRTIIARGALKKAEGSTWLAPQFFSPSLLKQILYIYHCQEPRY